MGRNKPVPNYTVAVLPKKEGFIYLGRNKPVPNYTVAVLPKKEWFIYKLRKLKAYYEKSQSYPKRRGSSIPKNNWEKSAKCRSPTQKGVVHLFSI